MTPTTGGMNDYSLVKGATSQNGKSITPDFITGRFDDRLHTKTNIIIRTD